MNLEFSVLPGCYAIVSRPAGDDIPEWFQWTAFATVAVTEDELSLVCPQENVPDAATASRNWRCLRITGSLDLSAVGILAEVSRLLAEHQVSVFAISTYQTDWVLVPAHQLDVACSALEKGGHRVIYSATASN